MSKNEIALMVSLAQTSLRVAEAEKWSKTDITVLLSNLALKAAQQLYALDAAFLPPAEHVQNSDIIPAGKVDTQPRQ